MADILQDLYGDTDEEFVAAINKVTPIEWIYIVLRNPSYLTDSYYFDFGEALYARGQDLINEVRKQRGLSVGNI